MMTKRLMKMGNSWGLIIDRPILDLLGIKDDAEVEITTDGTALRIAPKRPANGANGQPTNGQPTVMESYRKVAARHRSAFAKLAE